MSSSPLTSSPCIGAVLVRFVEKFHSGPRAVRLNGLVRLGLICASFPPALSFARDNQLPPCSIQSVVAPTLRKIQATATPAAAITSPWRAAAAYPTNIFRYGFAQNGDDFYIISGLSTDPHGNGRGPTPAMRRYNVTTNTWTSLADIPIASNTPSAVYYNGKIYVLAVLFGRAIPSLQILTGKFTMLRPTHGVRAQILQPDIIQRKTISERSTATSM
jgi:hypothetical protein